MPLFVITGYDVADSAALRQSVRAEHLARLNQLDSQGRLLIAGPTPASHVTQPRLQAQDDSQTQKTDSIQMTGSLIIAAFDTLESAQAWVADEPYLKVGVYSHVDIKPFIHVLPKSKSATKGA